MTEQNPSPATVIVVAAGRSTRFGGEFPKQYLSLHGQPVLRHTLSAFLACPDVGQICVVIHPEHRALYETAVAGLPRLLPPVYGGAVRQESVLNALLSLPPLPDATPILIHDAARPCVSGEDIAGVLHALGTYEAATLTCPVQDTLRRTEDGVLGEAVDRDGLMSLQTPQGFHYKTILEAHRDFAGRGMTDDTSLVTLQGTRVHAVTGSPSNIKITRPEDFRMAEHYLSSRLIPRTGLGFDVHAFGPSSSVIRLGGIDIPHTHKMEGHSDADVVLHAITDALYGAMSDGDIGSHFPPSNPDFKGMDSAVFLQDARDALTKRGGRITHIDTMIMCEAPKIGPHREAMRSRIAEILGIALSRVSVKATTTEGLGFTGRREGIAVQALASVILPEDDLT